MSRIPEITISVSDPVKCSDKFGQVYITYKITSSTNRSGFLSGSITVVRRYSDFSWLCGELSREFPGVIVPPLPEKQTVGRFGSDFVETRRRGLEKCLQRISHHDEIGNSQYFVTFLQADEHGMLKAKGDAKASKPPLTIKAMAWFEGTVNNIANGKTELEKSAADIKIEEIAQYVLALEKQMVNVTKHSEALVRRSREVSSAMFEFGQSITWLGQSEGDFIGTALTQMGTAADALSVSASAHAEQEAIKLLEPMEEYSRMLASIKTAMQQRQEKKAAYMAALSDVESKRNAHSKFVGVPGKEAQASAKEALVRAAEEGTDLARAEFEKVSERLLGEFETFKSQKAHDMKEIILSFVTLQIEFNRKSEDVWTELLPKVQAIALSQDGRKDSSGNYSAISPSGVGAFGGGAVAVAAGGYEDFSSVAQQQQYGSSYNSNFQEQDEDDMVGV